MHKVNIIFSKKKTNSDTTTTKHTELSNLAYGNFFGKALEI
jgi:hypothetical protein